MKCKEFKEFIQAYLDKELPIEVRKAWHQHLDECSICRASVQTFEKCITMMQQFMSEELPPKDLRERLKQRLGCDCFDFVPHSQQQEYKKTGDWIMSNRLNYTRKRAFWGMVLIVIGIVFLLHNLGYISVEVRGLILPSLLILCGIALIFRRRDSSWCCCNPYREKFAEK